MSGSIGRTSAIQASQPRPNRLAGIAHAMEVASAMASTDSEDLRVYAHQAFDLEGVKEWREAVEARRREGENA